MANFHSQLESTMRFGSDEAAGGMIISNVSKNFPFTFSKQQQIIFQKVNKGMNDHEETVIELDPDSIINSKVEWVTTAWDCASASYHQRHSIDNNQQSNVDTIVAIEEELQSNRFRPYTCPTCDNVFNDTTEFLEHKLVHKEERVSTPASMNIQLMRGCTIGLRRIEDDLNEARTEISPNPSAIHQWTSMRTPKFTCNSCGLDLNTKESLERHLFQHRSMNEQTVDEAHPAHILIINEGGSIHYQCGICTKTFKGHAFINYHRYCVPEQRSPYKCEECGKRFTRLSGLEYHKRIHRGVLPYSCPNCGKSFSVGGTLKRHMASKRCSAPPGFPCTHCTGNFPSKIALSAHFTLHTELWRPFACPHCNKEYIGITNFQDHIKTHEQAGGGGGYARREIAKSNFHLSSNTPLERTLERSRSDLGRHRCSNCHTTETTLWRKDEFGHPICNACRLYHNLHGVKRPSWLAVAPIRRRKKKTDDDPKTPRTVFKSKVDIETHHNQFHADDSKALTMEDEHKIQRRGIDEGKNGDEIKAASSSTTSTRRSLTKGKRQKVRRWLPGSFDCLICEKKFRRRADRNRHQKNIHETPRPGMQVPVTDVVRFARVSTNTQRAGEQSDTTQPPKQIKQQFQKMPTSDAPPTPVGRYCSNCKTDKTTLWRHGPLGERYCNACGVYEKLYGVKRPFKTDVIRSRISKKSRKAQARKDESTGHN